MKVAPIVAALDAAHRTRVLVHTGQHYDARMSQSFIAELGLPEPDHHLGVGSGTHAVQTARVMERFESVLTTVRPEWVVVVGDVNSTLACALVTAKLREELACRIAHVEAGLRSHDWRMPEEVNRVLTDRLADLLLTPSRDAEPNLLREGLDPRRIAFVGNVMIDTLFMQLPKARQLAMWRQLGMTNKGYVVATVHRPSNVDNRDSLVAVLEGLVRIGKETPVVLPLHPRTKKMADEFGVGHLLRRLHVLEPLGYVDMLSLTDGAAAVLTDSGGLQEETTVLGVPCVTLREQTERPVTVTEGTNRLAPWPLSASGIYDSYAETRARTSNEHNRRCPEGWDGHAAQRIVEHLV
jgi:UDP-N-acetylglucosamine 2-epimerase (non-hydrolysing)